MALCMPSTPSVALPQIGPCKLFIKHSSLYDEDAPRSGKAVPLTGFNGQLRKEGSLQCHNNNTNINNFDSIFAEVRTNYTNKGLKEAMEILSVMDQQEIPVHSDLYASLLEACAKHKALALGKRVHKHMLNRKIKQTPFLWSKLVNMYARCGSIDNARLLFEAMGKDRTVFSWNAMIAGYVTEGMCSDALELYSRMKGNGLKPDKFTFPRVLKACGGLGNLQEAKEIHYDIVKRGLEFDLFIANALMDVYAKCGYIEIARELFDKMPHRDIVSWNTIVAGSEDEAKDT